MVLIVFVKYFYFFDAEPNIESPLNSSAASLWSNQEGNMTLFIFYCNKNSSYISATIYYF